MKNKEKLDLLKDLSSRLPFGVNIEIDGKKTSSCLKPFLLPLSSMTETSLEEEMIKVLHLMQQG